MKTKIMALILLIAVVPIGIMLSKHTQKGQEINSTTSESYSYSLESTEALYEYMLKEYNGKLAVFETNSEHPVEVFSIFVDSLPQVDRDLLKDGIPASTKAELLRLIEDYTG